MNCRIATLSPFGRYINLPSSLNLGYIFVVLGGTEPN